MTTKQNLIQALTVNGAKTIKKAMSIIDKNGLGVAFVVNHNNRFKGIITDGDIRKAILQGIEIEKPVNEIANTRSAFIKGVISQEKINQLKLRKDIIPTAGSLKIPVLDNKGRVKNVLFLHTDKDKNVILSRTLKQNISLKEPKNVLIIGGAGYLGSVLSRLLLRHKCNVRVLDNLTYGHSGIEALFSDKNFQLIKGDCRNIGDLVDAIKNVDAVIHLAAIVGDPACSLDPEETIEINYLATKAIAETCKFNQINKFLFASSCSVYGASLTPQDRLGENAPVNPVSLYAQTKLRSEEGLLSIRDDNFMPTIFRFATLYGVSPRMRFDLVINTLTSKAVIDKKITIFGGKQFRPFINVADAAGACLQWLVSPIMAGGGEIFNVGANNQNYQIKDIGMIIKTVLPKTKIEIQKNADDIRDYNISFNKIRKILNFKAKKTIKTSVREIKNFILKENIYNINNTKYSNYRFLSKGKTNG